MRILKKKSLSSIEVYFIFMGCLILGYLSYLSLINTLFY